MPLHNSLLAQQPPKRGKHIRLPWSKSDPAEIIVHARYDQILGEFRRQKPASDTFRARYDRAKKENDRQAALDIVGECFSENALDRVVDRLMETDKEPIIIIPHPEWDAGAGATPAGTVTNALPFAFAYHMARALDDCEIDDKIIQITRPGRTKLKGLQRFLWQPEFGGTVRHDRAYIIADDVFHFGGTITALRSYVCSNGGTVVSASALAHTSGAHQRLPISSETLAKLHSMFTQEIDAFWREEIGHDTQCLTEPEGLAILKWGQEIPASGGGESILQRLRKDLDTTRAC